MWSIEPGVYLIPTAGGEPRRLTDKGRNPHFGASGERVYYTEDAQPAKESEPAHELVSVDLHGKDRQVHAQVALCDANGSLARRTLAGVPRELPRVRSARCRRADSSSSR